MTFVPDGEALSDETIRHKQWGDKPVKRGIVARRGMEDNFIKVTLSR